MTALQAYSSLDDHPEDRPALVSHETEEAMYSMAYQYYRNGKYEEAKNFFKFLTLSNPFERKYWMGLGAANHMLKIYQNAIECYSIAAVQDPNEPTAHWHAAECFYASGNTTDAFKALESAIEVAKGNDIHRTFVSQLELVQQAWLEKSKGVTL